MLNPATEETIARCRAAAPRTSMRRSRRRRQRCPEWLDTTPGERAEALLGLARVLEENAEELAAIESANVGKPLSYARDEIPVCVDNLRFFAGAARILEGKSAGEYMRGYTSMIRREPLGVVGGDRAVELPADDGGVEARARARRRQHAGAEAVRADAALAAAVLQR